MAKVEGWAVTVVSQSTMDPLLTVRDYYNCRISSLAGPEVAVARLAPNDRTLSVTASAPLTSGEVRALGLEPGQVKRREET